MIVKSNVSRNTRIEFVKSIVSLEKCLRKVHDFWSSNPDLEEELEESPWLDYNAIMLMHIEDDFKQSFDFANKVIELRSGFGNEHESNYLLNIEIYYRGVGNAIIELMNVNGSCTDTDMVIYKVQTDMVYRYVCVAISNICELDKDKFDEEYLLAMDELGIDPKEYAEFITGMSDKLPISSNKYVIENYDFIQEQLKVNDVDKDVFIQFSSAIMPYDIVAMKTGELVLNNNYVKRLELRTESPHSLINCCPEVFDITDSITADCAYEFYLYEFSFNEGDIDNIKRGVMTVREVIDCAKAQAGGDITNMFE